LAVLSRKVPDVSSRKRPAVPSGYYVEMHLPMHFNDFSIQYSVKITNSLFIPDTTKSWLICGGYFVLCALFKIELMLVKLKDISVIVNSLASKRRALRKFIFSAVYRL